MVVVSHNREFVTRLSTTHTVKVEGGEVKFLDRPPRDNDWEHDEDGAGWRCVFQSEGRISVDMVSQR